MEIVDFDREFVERTKKMIEYSSVIKSEYDVTLLVNCMLALIALPTERTGNNNKSRKFKSEITVWVLLKLR